MNRFRYLKIKGLVFALLFTCVFQVYLTGSEREEGISSGLSYLSTPEIYDSSSNDRLSVFLAGSASFPWRIEFEKKLNDHELTLIDPTYKKNDPWTRIDHIRWEHEHIDKADVLLAWLPANEETKLHTLSLTTLFELGRFAQMKEKKIVMGIHPEYYKRNEVMLQLSILRPEVEIVSSLDELAVELNKIAETYPGKA